MRSVWPLTLTVALEDEEPVEEQPATTHAAATQAAPRRASAPVILATTGLSDQ